jgi:2,5-dichloro-2,5-cyclohexadiene-1,4-diol dehydrogenase 1
MNTAYHKLDLSGRVIIVTGGGDGLGFAAARLMALRGATLVIADVDTARGEKAVQSLGELGANAAFIRTDVAVEEDAKAMVEFAVGRFGGLHGAFNNAGISGPVGPLADLSVQEWRRTLDVNLHGVFLCLKYELAYLQAHGGGAIVNTSSSAGAVGVTQAAAYVSSKHGVVGLTRVAALDYAQQGIRVNAVLPGSFRSPLLERVFENAEIRARIEGGHPIGRVGEVDEIAETVAWLLSDAASFMTGACINHDGGYTTP